MSLSLLANFAAQTNLVLPLASNNNGLAVRVASLGSATLGTLTVVGLQGTATWTLSATAPAWVTTAVNTAGTVCTLSFAGAQYQSIPYEFFVSCTDGVNPAVSFPIFLEVKAPFLIAPVGGSTTLTIPSYDSTVSDIQILGYGLASAPQSDVNFILPTSLPTGLNFVTSNENQLVLRVSEPHFGDAPYSTTDLIGGLQTYTTSPVVTPLTLQAYQPGSFYDEPDRAYTLTLSVSSQTQKAGTLDFGLGAYFNTTSSLLEVDADVDVLLGILQSSGTPVATPLKYHWTNDSSLALNSGGTLTSTSATYTISALTSTGSVSLQIQDANGLPVASGLKTINFNELGPSSSSWLGTPAIKVGVTPPVGSTPSKVTGYLGQTLNITLSSPEGFNFSETIYFTMTATPASSIESGLAAPVITSTASINTGTPTTAVSFQFPAGTAIGDKWALGITASNVASGTPTRQGYAQVLVECLGKTPLVVGGVTSTINASTGTNITPIQLSATDALTSATVAATFELVGGSEFGPGVISGAPDGVYINTSNQIAGNALTPGTYKFVVAASATGYQRSYSVVVTMTVTAVATQLVIANPTSTVSSVQDNTTFTVSWTTSGTATALYLAQAPPAVPTVNTVTGNTSLVVQQVGSSVYGVYGTNFYGTSYSVPLVVISSSIAQVTNLPPAPTTAVIDENYKLTANWQPYTVNGAYTAYLGWNVTLQTPPTTGSTVTTFTDGLENGGTASARVFVEQLSAGDYSMNMVALSANHSVALNSNPWDFSHNFPTTLQAANVTFDNTNLLLGQTLTITLNSNYDGAAAWQILFPDNTSTGWLPLSTRSIVKLFNTSGAQNIVIQTQNDYGTSNPPVKLRRQFTQQIYVVNQQYNPGAVTQGDLTGTLGIGGNVMFEIVDASTSSVTPQPYEVVVRSIARDTVTNELKLMVATSRFSNASSLLNTMAIDVFPMMGRPHAKELIEPIYILETNSATSAIPVKITTTLLPSNSYVGKPMQEFKMQAIGGSLTTNPSSASWYATGLPPGLKMNVDGTISGTPTTLGAYTVNFACMDSSSPAYIAETTLTFTIPTDLKIVSLPLPNAVVGTPYPGASGQITNTGGLAPYTWQVVAGALPIGMTLDSTSGVLGGVPCTYTSKFPNSDYTETYTFVVQVTDAINAMASQNFSIKLAPTAFSLGAVDQPNIGASEQYKLAVPIYGGEYPYSLSAPTDSGVALVNGQIEYLVTPTTAQIGTLASFNVTVLDSNSAVAHGPIQYRVKTPVSAVYVGEAFFDNYWGAGDTTTVTHGIIGNLGGFSIQPSTTTLSDGLTLTITGGATPTVAISGPPTSYSNTQQLIQIPILQGSSQVATITREYTLLSHSGTNPAIGATQCFTRPYIVGNFVGLNPLKPWFNSPTVTLTGLTARMQAGSVLPPGLSFDSNTMLVYGTLLGNASTQSIIEYIDVNSVIQATVTITWNTQTGVFQVTDGLLDGQTGTAFAPGTSIISSTSSITGCGVMQGRLPAGLSIASPSGNQVSIVGTPTEAGYFDVWFHLTNSSNQAAFLYHRFFVDYINPLVILTSSLPTGVVGETYNAPSGFQLQGFGGIPFSPPAQPYTWSLASTPAGMTFNTSTGVLSGAPTTPGTTSLNFTVTDSRGVTALATIPFTVINSVTIQTTVLPTIQVNVPYSFTLAAVGGTLPYTWSCPQLPLSGISLNASTGVISGTTTSIIAPTSISITVQDAGTPQGSDVKPFTLQTGAQGGMYIDASGVGAIDRGAPYQGTLQALGTTPGVPNLPVTWRVDSTSPNPLPAGLTLQANSGNQGATATISGSYTGVLSSYPVIISATDNIGNLASVTVSLNTTSSLAITTTSLSQGVVAVPYSTTLNATGYNTPFVWSATGLPSGLTLTANNPTTSATLSGTVGSAFNSGVVFHVSDSLSPADTAAATLTLVISASSLQITTSSLPQGTAGVAYSASLLATGGVAPYTWSISPSSASSLPSGLGLNTSTGAISGTTSSVGTTTITFRVTDNIGSYVDKALSLTIISGLKLYTGIDYTGTLTTNYLGYIDTGSVASINPRPNYSFYVIATGVVTTNPSTLQSGITVPSGFTATVTSLSGGIGRIALSGSFSSGAAGDNSFSISVTDSGVTASGSFKWFIYNDGILRATATNAFPTQLTTA
jgi:hypothetical protein